MPTVDRPDFHDWDVPKVPRRWQEAPQTAVAGPAKAIMAVAVIGLIIAGLTQGYRLFIWASFRPWWPTPSPTGPAFGMPIPTAEELVFEAAEMAQGTIQLAGMIIAIVGARKMLRLESYGMALSAAVLMMLPWVSPCCLLGLPFGTWAIAVLNRPEVREAFRS